jgi:hypothetical protein
VAAHTFAPARLNAAWYRSPLGARMATQEEALLVRLLIWLSDARPVVGVGCGTGHFTR